MAHSIHSLPSPALAPHRARRAPGTARSAVPAPRHSPPTVSSISLFVDDLPAARRFYREVFGVQPLFEDADSVVVQFENVVVTLVQREESGDRRAPRVAPEDAGPRFQLSLWVADVDAVCEALRRWAVQRVDGPHDRPWGMRTACFVDPAGHRWEVAQRI